MYVHTYNTLFVTLREVKVYFMLISSVQRDEGVFQWKSEITIVVQVVAAEHILQKYLCTSRMHGLYQFAISLRSKFGYGVERGVSMMIKKISRYRTEIHET